MSYYLYCKNVEVCLDNHETYHSKEDVLEQIKENNRIIEQHKQVLFGMCCGNPKDLFTNKDYGSPIEEMQHKFYNIFSEEYNGIEYLIAHNVDLQYIADNWDKHEEG